MEIILISVLVVTTGLILWSVYRLFKWVLINKLRTIMASTMIILIGLGLLVNQLFFKHMQFIQSKVYPDLYLIKYPVKDTNQLQIAIHDFVKQQHLKNNISNLSFRFYKYTKPFNPLIFGDAGTSYFIEHEEDFGGFSVEELTMYSNEKLAIYTTLVCDNNHTEYCGQLQFYNSGKMTTTIPFHQP